MNIHIRIPLALCAMATVVHAQTIPGTINYQGRLTDNSPQQNPLTATTNMSFELWDVASGGTTGADRLWVEPASGTVPVAVTSGVFNVQLGQLVPLGASVFTGGSDRYLQVIVNGEALAPRQRVSSAAFAQVAATAGDSSKLGGVAAAGWQRAVSTSCPAGAYLSSVDAAGGTVCTNAQGALVSPLILYGFQSGGTMQGTNYSTGPGVAGTGGSGYGVSGASTSAAGVYGSSGSGAGVYGQGSGGAGVYGASASGPGIYGTSTSGDAGYFAGHVELAPAGNLGVGTAPTGSYRVAVNGGVSTTQGVKEPITFLRLHTTTLTCDFAQHTLMSYAVNPAVASVAEIVFTGASTVTSNNPYYAWQLYVDNVSVSDSFHCGLNVAGGMSCPSALSEMTNLASGSHTVEIRYLCYNVGPTTGSAWGTLKTTLHPQ